MIAALIVSPVFLTSYLIYHYHVGGALQRRGWVRPLYFLILIPHVTPRV